MGGEELDGVDVSWHGVAGDRRWALIRDGQVRSGFPWLTIRERPELAHYRPRFAEPDRPNVSPTLVRTPSGRDLDVADPALAAELGSGLRVIKLDRGIFDAMPLSLLTIQSVTSLSTAPTWRRRGSGPTSSWMPRGPTFPRTPGSAGSCASASCACAWTHATCDAWWSPSTR